MKNKDENISLPVSNLNLYCILRRGFNTFLFHIKFLLISLYLRSSPHRPLWFKTARKLFSTRNYKYFARSSLDHEIGHRLRPGSLMSNLNIILNFPDKDTLFRWKFDLFWSFLRFRIASRELEFLVILLKILRVSEDLSVALFVWGGAYRNLMLICHKTNRN